MDVVNLGQKEIHILSKGRKKVTSEDIETYKAKLLGGAPSSVARNGKAWEVPTSLYKIFAMDLQKGMNFCVTKYGVTSVDIMREAARVAPHFRIKEDR